MPKPKGRLRILACKSGAPFAKKVLDRLIKKRIVRKKEKIIGSNEVRFANREVKIEIGESIRDADVYIFQDVENSVAHYSVDENFMALKTAIDAARTSDAKCITAILPVFPYARQDKAKGRECITAAVVAREIEDAGANYVITLDVHNPAIAGFFRKAKFEILHASKNIIDFITTSPQLFDFEKLVIMSADLGGAERAEHYAKILGKDLVFAYKERNNIPNAIESMKIIGDLEGRVALIIDDIIDTGETILKVAKQAKEKGAEKVYVACSLPLFNGEAIKRITEAYQKGHLAGVIGTDAVYHGGEEFKKQNPWFTEVSVVSYFAKVIEKLNRGESISKLLV